MSKQIGQCSLSQFKALWTDPHYTSEQIEAICQVKYQTMKNNASRYKFKRGRIELENKSQPTKEGDMATKTKKQITEEMRLETQLREQKKKKSVDDQKYRALQDELTDTQRALKIALDIKDRQPNPFKIEVRASNGKGESTAVALLSDVHCEEIVPAHKVNYLNEYNPDISKRRVSNFFDLVVRFIRVERHNTRVENLVLWLGGDYFTNDMHGAPTAFAPVDAMLYAEDMLISGLKFILENEPKLNIKVVGSVGNHSRMQVAKQVNQALEQENSLEWIMYHHIKALFQNEKRIQFQLDNSYHTYVDIYGKIVRFNHGHLGFRYNKGQAGVHGPLFKAINEVWDKQIKADLTCCAHYHTYTPASTMKSRNYIVNGSCIGPAPYGMQLGYEDPIQTFFFIHNRHGLVGQTPLYVDL